MEKAIKVIEYFESEFGLKISHLQKVDLERILTKNENNEGRISVCLCVPTQKEEIGSYQVWHCEKCTKPKSTTQ